MRRRYLKKSPISALLIVAAAVVLGYINYKGEPEEENTAPISIDVSGLSESTESQGSSLITVSSYKKTKADNISKMVKEIDSYSELGTLKEQLCYTEYTEIEKGLVGSGKQSGCNEWTIEADGTRTQTMSCSYVYNDDGQITEERVTTTDSDDLDTKTTYSYTLTGDVSMAQVYYLDEYSVYQLASTAVYNYSDSGNLISATFTEAGNEDSTRRIAYINNTNGSPVKITTTDKDGNVATIETKGYYDTGNVAYSKVCDTDGNVVSKTYYYYDDDGYLIRTAVYKQNDIGALLLYRINIYSYY